jgi:hypothetical protein
LKNSLFIYVCSLLITLGILALTFNQFAAEQAGYAEPQALSDWEWQQRLDDLRSSRRTLARAAGTCERGLDARLAANRMSQDDLAQLATELKVQPIEATRFFCRLFMTAVKDRKLSLQEFNWAVEAQPSEVLKALRRQ